MQNLQVANVKFDGHRIFPHILMLQSQTYHINVDKLLNVVKIVVKLDTPILFNNGSCKFSQTPHIKYNKFYTRTNALFTALISCCT